MTPENYAAWLQGFFAFRDSMIEYDGAHMKLTDSQTQLIKDKLAEVVYEKSAPTFDKEGFEDVKKLLELKQRYQQYQDFQNNPPVGSGYVYALPADVITGSGPTFALGLAPQPGATVKFYGSDGTTPVPFQKNDMVKTEAT